MNATKITATSSCDTYSVGSTLFTGRIQIQYALVAVLSIIFCISTENLCFPASARAYHLIPRLDGKDLSRGNKRVLVTAPSGWEVIRVPKRWVRDYAMGFRRDGLTDAPVIEIETNHIGRHYSAKLTPRNSYTGVNLETDIKELKHIESFDAGANGILDVWQFHTYNRNYLLVLIVQPDTEGRTEVDVYLSSKDPGQLMPYLNSLKEAARSIRVVNR
jgi:hypothetical protein